MKFVFQKPGLPQKIVQKIRKRKNAEQPDQLPTPSAPPANSMYPCEQSMFAADNCDSQNNLSTQSQNNGPLATPFNINEWDDEFELPSIRSNITPRLNITIPEQEILQNDLENHCQQQLDEDKLQQIIIAFNNQVEVYPTFPCPICRRKVYKKRRCVRNYTFTQYIINQMRKIDFNDFEVGSKVLMCQRCADTFTRRKIPTMIYMNKMEMDEIPECIAKLTEVELRLISQVKLFMKIYHLCKGRGQQAIKGSCLHFPQSVDQIIEQLPLSPDRSDIVIVNETNQAGQLLNEFQVRGKEIYEALQYLKQNNPLYANIDIGALPEEDLQINQINGQNDAENNVGVDVARLHVLSQPSRGYVDIDNNRSVLRATIHQGIRSTRAC